jgi:predicted DNA-binding protein
VIKKKKRGYQGRNTKVEPTTTIGIYLRLETYERIKDQSEIKCTSMATIMRYAISKLVRSEGRV